MHDSRDDEHHRALALRHGRPRTTRDSSFDWPRTASFCFAATPSSAATSRIPLRRPRCSTPTAGSTRRHRRPRRRRLRQDHRPQEGHHRHGRGDNIAPQNLENDLKVSKYISQAIVVGDRRPFPPPLYHARRGRGRPSGRRLREFDGDTAALADRPEGDRPGGRASWTRSTASGHATSRSRSS